MKKRLSLPEMSALVDIKLSGQVRFALQLHPIEKEQINFLEMVFKGHFEDLRYIMYFFPPDEWTALTKGRSLLYWHSLSQYCPNCGVKNERNAAGSQRVCISCHRVHYPSLFPVVICVPADKHKCLLVRQPRHISGMYTAVAGFVEPGETPEDAVRREVAEEVGIEVGNLEYFQSQHWPFPLSSLLVGFHAAAKADQMVDIDKRELDDAQWFDLNTVKKALHTVQQNPSVIMRPEKNQLLIPPPGPIAHYLIKEWVERNER